MFGLEIKNLSLFQLQNEEKYFSNIQHDPSFGSENINTYSSFQVLKS